MKLASIRLTTGRFLSLRFVSTSRMLNLALAPFLISSVSIAAPKSAPAKPSAQAVAAAAAGAALAPIKITELKGSLEKKCPSKNLTPVLSAELANVSAAGKLAIQPFGSGIREKKIAFVNINVYCAQYWTVSSPDLTGSGQILGMALMRDVPTSRLQEAFTAGLAHNGVDISQAPFAAFFKLFGSIKEVKEGELVLVAGVKAKDQSALTVTLPNGKSEVIPATEAQVDQFFSIWFGKPVDSNMEKLSASLKGS